MGLSDLVQNSSAAPATPAPVAPKSTPMTGAPVPASYAPAVAPTMATTSAPKQSGLAGLVASSSQAQPLDEHQSLSIRAQADAEQARKDSVDANSPMSVIRGTASDLAGKMSAPGKAIVGFAKDNAERLFPSTAQTVRELGVDPLSLKADPKKALSDAWNGLKTTVQNQTQNYRDMFEEPTAAGKVGAGLKTAKGFADIAFSPITTLFTAANDIPVLGSIAKIVSLPFNAAGDAGKDVGIQAVKDLPISQAAKDKIAPGIEDIFALAAQIVAGGAIHESVRESLAKKYGAKDAATIEAKAQEMAEAHKGHDDGVKAQGESVAHPGIESLVNNSSANDGNTVYSGAKGDGTTFHTPDLETAQRHARMAGATEVTKADIAGKNILEVSPEDMQKAVEDPANREKYDGVKFQAEGEPHPTYALFDKAAETAGIDDEMAGNIMDAYKTDGMTEQELSDTIAKKAGIDPAAADKIAESAKVLKSEGGTPDGKWLAEAIRNPSGEDAPSVNVNKPAAPQLDREQKAETPATDGEKATSSLAANTRARAIEAGIEADFGELPEYAKMNMADEAAKADALVSSDIDRALRIAEMKETPGAGDPRAASVYKALELKADAEGDAELALRLAKSPLATEMSVKGQEIKALDRGEKDTATKRIKDVQEAREKNAEKKGKNVKKATKETVDEIKKEMKKNAPKKADWNSFIDSIRCGY